jgi:microcin C transport system ATP-binding protein
MSASETVLDVRELGIRFHQDGRVIDAVRGVSFSVGKGETVALVGESTRRETW